MKTIEELERFYAQTLKPEIDALEVVRKKTAAKIVVVSVIGALVAGVVGWLMRSLIYQHIGVLAVPVLVFVIPLAIAASVFPRQYVADFKDRIIRGIIRFISPELEYFPRDFIQPPSYYASQLFKQRADRYKGDDFVRGRIDKTAFQFSELHTEYRTRDSRGNSQYHTIFKGLFFIADFNKNFMGRTVVLPDVGETLLGRLGTWLQSHNPNRDELVKLEDVEFEKAFAVYSTDQIEARYILSPALMRRILDLKAKTSGIALSFVQSCVFIAITYQKNLLEPRLFRTIQNFDMIREYYNDLALAVGIVDELNLNTRIWTKE